jgi:hypothetical protein
MAPAEGAQSTAFTPCRREKCGEPLFNGHLVGLDAVSFARHAHLET